MILGNQFGRAAAVAASPVSSLWITSALDWVGLDWVGLDPGLVWSFGLFLGLAGLGRGHRLACIVPVG